MKKFTALLALFCAGLLAASFAAAQPPPGKGKPEGKGKKTTTSSTDPATCKPKISVIIKGKFISGGGDSFTMDVTQTNFHGRDLVGSSLKIKVDEKTRFVRRGPAKLADFKADDRLNVQARACKKQKNAAPSTGPAAELLAKRVVGRPANPAEIRNTTTTTAAP